MTGIKHSIQSHSKSLSIKITGPNWNADHSIDNSSIPLTKLLDHNKEVHDTLGINADTVDGLHAEGLEKVANKGAISGYAPLDTNQKVPVINLGGAGADNTKYLRGDQSWQTPPGGGGTPGDTVVTEKAFGQSETAGASTDYSRKDHTHGTPTDPVPTHANLTTGVHGVGVSTIESIVGSQGKVDSHKDLTTGIHGVGASTIETIAGSAAKVSTHDGLASPHSAATNLEKTTNKGAVSGYAPLDTVQKVPTANLGGAGADNTKYLRGDQTWNVPAGGVVG